MLWRDYCNSKTKWLQKKKNFEFFKTAIKTSDGDSELHWNSKR